MRRHGKPRFLLASTALLLWLAAMTAGAGASAGAPKAHPAARGGRPAVPVEQLPGAAGAAARPARRDARDGGVTSRRIRVLPASVGPQESRLDVVVDGRRIPFRNGGRVELADGLAAELFLDPYPPTKLRLWLDVYLLQGPKATPLSNARATMDYDMRFMPHGPFSAAAKNIGQGHYLFAIDYFMYGAWDQMVRITVGKVSYELPLVVIASPGI